MANDSTPKTIAILGASSNRAKYGNKCVRAYLHAGWTVYPVNPGGGEIEGLAVYRSLDAVPKPLDRISVYLAPPISLALLPEMAAAKAGDVMFNPGSADEVVLRKARELGIEALDYCSIVAIGLTPAMFPG
ncbi:MAG: CoA-binding protein [Thermoanaerobaculia bacterium]|nr:CoA-binding protein [Thermoanaerobaculia bacterium]